MRQPMTDQWIEAAEARKVCEWAMAEQPSGQATAPSLTTKLCELLVAEAAHLRLVLVPTARPAA